MAKKSSLIYLHTSGSSKPIGLLKLGELAIQHISNNPSDCRIYIDTATDTTSSSEDTIVEFVPKSYVDDQINKLLNFIENPKLLDYYCLDSSATPIVVNDGYRFDNSVTEITPCTYDLSNITTLNSASGATTFPSGLTSITANMESLETTNINNEEAMTGGSFFNMSSVLKSADLYLPNLTDGSYMLPMCTGLTEFNGIMPKLTNGENMFTYCMGLTKWNILLPKLTNGKMMFTFCTNLNNVETDLPELINGESMFSNSGLKKWNILLPKLSNGDGMFGSCSGLTNWDIELPNLTNGRGMFVVNNNLVEYNANMPKLTNGNEMFSGCTSLTSFTSDLSSLITGSYMFQSCNLTNWDIPLPKLTDGTYMFGGCSSLTSFTSDLSSLTSGTNMFSGCSSLTSWNISLPKLKYGGASYGGMFSNCSNLTSFTSDLSSLTDGEYMFSGCTSLTNVTLNGSLNCNNLSFSASTALTVDSMVNIINALADRSSTSSYTLNLGSTNLAKLTDGQKAVATNKNWTLS